MVEQLCCHPPPHRIADLLRRQCQQLCKGIRRRIQGGTSLPFQRRQIRQMCLGPRVEPRTAFPRLSVRRTQQHRRNAVLQPAPEAVVGHAVPQLPVGQYHAHVRRRVQRRIARNAAASPNRMHRAALGAHLPCSVRQHHRQKSQIIVQDHPPHQAVPRTQRVAQPAVGGAERLTVRRRQPVIRRPHIAEHLSEHP